MINKFQVTLNGFIKFTYKGKIVTVFYNKETIKDLLKDGYIQVSI